MDYEKITQFWKSCCEEILAKNSNSEKWAPWIPKKFANGVLISEGDPVFDLLNPVSRRAVRIIQENNLGVETTHKYAAWVSRVNEEDDSPATTIEELVFTCEEYQNQSSIFTAFFERWIDPNTSYEEMGKIIEERYILDGVPSYNQKE
jgi:hypothetical protein